MQRVIGTTEEKVLQSEEVVPESCKREGQEAKKNSISKKEGIILRLS